MQIDEKTNIPLFAVVVSLPFLVGAILWLSSVDSKATEAKDKLSNVQDLLSGVQDKLTDIRERVIRIEDQVKKQ